MTSSAGAYRVLCPPERYHIRAGRGPIQDTEIRAVGGPIVMGEIPGVVATVGCSNYPGSWNDVGSMAEEFLKRRYIVVTSGCTAISIGMYRNEDGEGLYDIYPGRFDAGGLVNCGSCVSNAHISGAAIKIASIFAKRRLNSNYEEIADYVHHRVGAVGIAWGAMSQKAAAIAAGFWRLGIPVIAGPHGAKYRRMLLGRKDREEDWYVLDARTGERVYAGPVPEHLFTVAETREEAMVLVPKLCMRPNDTVKGRSIKLTHYIDLHKKFFGEMPDDLPLLVRTRLDIPITTEGRGGQGPCCAGVEGERAAHPRSDHAPEAREEGREHAVKGEVWLRAETPAIVRATIIEKPVVAARLLKRAKSPVIVVGHEAAEGDGSGILDLIARVALATGAPVVATGGISGELGKKGVRGSIVLSAMEAGDRLLDPGWRPAPYRDPPDYAFIIGVPFTIASVIEAGLASFARGHLKLVSLDRLYHPHCDLSLPNQSREEWEKNLEAIALEVEKE